MQKSTLFPHPLLSSSLAFYVACKYSRSNFTDFKTGLQVRLGHHDGVSNVGEQEKAITGSRLQKHGVNGDFSLYKPQDSGRCNPDRVIIVDR